MDRGRWAPYALVSLLAAVPYLATPSFDFVFDDRHLIVDNTFVQAPWSPLTAFAHHFWYGSPYGAAYYRPVVVASLALNGRLLGWGPAGFHAVNILLHALNAALLLALARRLGCPARAALLAAALFAVHPVAAWPVASIVARVDLLAATFALLAWLGLASGGGYVWAAGASFLLALLSKESAAALLIVPLLNVRGLRGGPSSPGRWKGMAILAAAGAAYLACRNAAGIGLLPRHGQIDPLTNPLGVLPAAVRIPAAAALAGRYLLYLLAPVRFHDPTSYFGQVRPPGPADPVVLLSACGLLAAIAFCFALWLRRDPISVPLAFSIASFLPASNLIVPIASLYAQNFLYLPLVGLALAIGMAIGRLNVARPGSARFRVAAVAAAMAAVLGVASWRESGIWKDEESLFGALAERFPGYAPAHSALGVALIDRGRPREAIAPLRAALALTDQSLEAHYNLGLALFQTSREPSQLQEALSHFEWVIRERPDFAPARYQAARVLDRLGRGEEAEAEASEARRLEGTKKNHRALRPGGLYACSIVQGLAGRRPDRSALVGRLAARHCSRLDLLRVDDRRLFVGFFH